MMPYWGPESFAYVAICETDIHNLTTHASANIYYLPTIRLKQSVTE